MIKTLSSFIALMISLAAFAGGGWPQKKGFGYFKINQYFLQADKYFNPEGNKIDVLPQIGYYSTSFYGEYGISDRITAIAFVPFFNRLTLNRLVKLDGTQTSGDQLNGLGDADFALKYGLKEFNNFSFAGSLTLGIPLGDPSGGETGTLQSGDGEFNQMISLDVGFSNLNFPFYANTTLAFNNRTQNLSDEIRFALEAGTNISKKMLLILRLQNVNSLRNGDQSTSSVQGLFSNNIEYTLVSPEINWSFTDTWGMSASLAYPLNGSQVLGNTAWNFGFYYQLRPKY